MACRRKKQPIAKRVVLKSRRGPSGAAAAPLLSVDTALCVERAAREFRKHLTSDGIDAIVIADLSALLSSLKHDLDRRIANKCEMSVFENDRKKDIAMLRRHVYAFETVLRYYGGVPEL
jgi:hypothetical protein